MDILLIEETDHTPKVVLDHVQNKFEISGDSRPENARKFFEPILNWIDEYIKSADSSAQSNFEFKLEYFNSTSAKFILDLVLKLQEGNQANNLFRVKWYYDEMDVDMQESGEEFESMAEMEFEFIAIED